MSSTSSTSSVGVAVVSCVAAVVALRILKHHWPWKSNQRGHLSESERNSLCLADIELLGKANLPAHVVKYYSYTSGDGRTFSALSQAYDSIQIMTRVLAGVSGDRVDTKVKVFGQDLSSPIMIAPTAFHKLAHDEGEVATARAAAAAGVNFVYSFMLSNTIADKVCAASTAGPKWAHLYILVVAKALYCRDDV